jgi:hypothetical protein
LKSINRDTDKKYGRTHRMDKNQLKKIISLVKYKLFNFSEEEWESLEREISLDEIQSNPWDIFPKIVRFLDLDGFLRRVDTDIVKECRTKKFHQTDMKIYLEKYREMNGGYTQ